MNKCTKLFIL